MKFTFRDIVWVAIITLILIVLSKCHRDDKERQQINIGKLQEKLKADSVFYSTKIQVHERVISAAQQTVNRFSEANKTIEHKLDSTTALATRLAKRIKAYSDPGIDTTLTTVGPEYLQYCDSLADATNVITYNFGKYKKNTNAILAAKDTIINSKDSIITVERTAKLGCLQDYNTLMHYYKSLQSATTNRNQLYIGAELMSTPSYFISNVGVALSLRTKTNKLWQVSGGIQANGNYYARINGNILIKLK